MKTTISFLRYTGEAVLNSYGMLFFSRNQVFSLLIIVVSFFTPFAGACGMGALLAALLAAHALGFGKDQIRNGLITYSVVLFGLGMGTNFEFGPAFALLLVIGALLTLFLSVSLNAVLNKRGLPALSLAFIISTALLIVASKSFSGIGLTHRHIYWYNEMYALGGSNLVNMLQRIENWSVPDYVAGFFRSMSAILFQVNIASGIILSVGLIIYSRIAFLLMVLGYAVAIVFSYIMGAFQAGDMSYYNMGTNFMLVAVALGGFYLIASRRSFAWILVTVPIAYLLVTATGSLLFKIGVPVFSLPFCLTVILFLHMLQMRKQQQKLVLTPVQYYSPEINLYRYTSGKERLHNRVSHILSLPFMGEWMVSQGYDGKMTHRGDWGKAIDFVILDNEMKTYQTPGTLPEHFYCYNKPVCASADGIVEEITDHIEDNEIGNNNTQQNWGNSIVIRHGEGLYTKLSHLKKGSFKVVKGAYVKRGEILAHCGNSGRSPEPHLHFQVQSTPHVGSKTMAYPFGYFSVRNDRSVSLKDFTVPAEGVFVNNIVVNAQLYQAFNFQPGFVMKVSAPGFDTEEWEVCTSVYNETYLYCVQKDAAAYFINNGTVFCFTHYFGSRKTLLFLFYQAAFKVLLNTEREISVQDYFPVNLFGTQPFKWIQDLLAPFYIFVRMRFESQVATDNSVLGGDTLSFSSRQVQEFFRFRDQRMTATVNISDDRIQTFTIKMNNKTIEARCDI